MNDAVTTATPRAAPASLLGPPAAGVVAGALRVLVLSPFSPLPPDAGQRRRVYQTLQLLKDAGLSVSLLLYAFEGPWAWRFQQDVADRLRREFDDVFVLPAQRGVGAPPRDGTHHALDEWWDDLLGTYLARLFETHHFDVLLVNNVWLSKALSLVPPNVVKVIDMHDLFHLRERAYDRGGIVPEFFRITEKDELFGLNRADVCVAISLPEATYLADVIDNAKVVYLPYAPADRLPEPFLHGARSYLHDDKVVFGFLGTSHTFNVAGVRALLEELCTTIAENFAPIELVFGGTVCDAIAEFGSRIRMTRLGWVEDEDAFFDLIDFCIVPVFHGSGFKIKVADILHRGKPALFAQHAADGLSLDAALLAADASAMAGAMSRIAFERPSLARYGELVDEACRNLTDRVAFGANAFLAALDRCVVEGIIDLRGREGADQRLALLSHVALAREVKDVARVRILVDRIEPWLRTAASLLPPSVSVEIGWNDGDASGNARNRVWWAVGSGPAVPGAATIVADLRFAEEIRGDDPAHEMVLSPDQIAALGEPSSPRWSCLPYLTESVLWDPVARAILHADTARADDDGAVDVPIVIVIVDGDHESRLPLRLFRRSGRAAEIVDVRDPRATLRLLAALRRTADRKGRIAKILDGCTGLSPLRRLVLEMAVVCNVPVSTGAFGPAREIAGEMLAECRRRKIGEDQAAFHALARDLDAMRGRLRRL